ncbi:MAG TPA: hypothetical protein PLR20_10775 [Syntrophales bacterium]|nr:hypothetical protein [Syntrophales bacterium]HOX93495.1 hypothetical protein [Syntrophales bacterium]HPI57535.1 hypothetical protein [Syntrophales bacterium]HPN24692.1 hypothetical protein [Syntrophales bacterium]HQM29823.1 hypothetical protein [Syntrophales bacterium]
MKGCLICPECAYTTADRRRRCCEYCRAALIGKCPICKKPIREERAIYCKDCGTKLRISCVPIQ